MSLCKWSKMWCFLFTRIAINGCKPTWLCSPSIIMDLWTILTSTLNAQAIHIMPKYLSVQWIIIVAIKIVLGKLVLRILYFKLFVVGWFYRVYHFCYVWSVCAMFSLDYSLASFQLVVDGKIDIYLHIY